MGRKWFVLWHALFSLAAGVLYFFCVLPRWYELMGEMPQALGMAGRIAAGALVGLAALPVVFVLLRSRKPELGTPQLALSIRTWSIVAHVLAGVLIVGTAISEIWLKLDSVGQYLFAIYGAAAAIALLGMFGFYLSFVAELPPPPPKPIKAKKPASRRLGRKKDAEKAQTSAAPESDEPATAEAGEPEAEEPGAPEAAPGPAADSADTAEAGSAEEEDEAGASEDAGASQDAGAGLRNRRPTGKGSHRMRRRRTRGGVALDEQPNE
ncbi:hypothetical protein [Mycobacterium parmense]|nr:hypothetical protein [Mycobacterium parmense]MCV7352909.1 hypothetical protein [Mycobacterium parmense]ORW55499.1 hypothetical protein AWC20_18230 [Mycobacterium parmense]